MVVITEEGTTLDEKVSTSFITEKGDYSVEGFPYFIRIPDGYSLKVMSYDNNVPVVHKAHINENNGRAIRKDINVIAYEKNGVAIEIRKEIA